MFQYLSILCSLLIKLSLRLTAFSPSSGMFVFFCSRHSLQCVFILSFSSSSRIRVHAAVIRMPTPARPTGTTRRHANPSLATTPTSNSSLTANGKVGEIVSSHWITEVKVPQQTDRSHGSLIECDLFYFFLENTESKSNMDKQ